MIFKIILRLLTRRSKYFYIILFLILCVINQISWKQYFGRRNKWNLHKISIAKKQVHTNLGIIPNETQTLPKKNAKIKPKIILGIVNICK